MRTQGNQNLALTATGAATVSLTGSALAVSATDSCEESPYYGTMTEEIFGSVWQNDVVALGIENSDIDLTVPATEALIVRAVFGGNVASQRKDNSNFTFTVLDGGDTYATVAEETGIVTAVSAGTATIEVTLTGHANVPPAYAQVTVTGA